SITLADSGLDVTLVEKSESLGGNLRHVYFLAEGLNPQRLLRDLINRVRGHHRIQVITRGTVNKVSGSLGQFKSVIVQQSEFGELSNIDIEHGVVIIATGGVEGSTNQYLRSEDDRVITQLELEDWLIHDPEKIMRLNNLVMVQCVEAQEIGRFYCSRTCCTSTMKNAIRLKMMNPDCQVTVLYRDIITYGFREQYYTEARERGVVFVRYSEDNSPVVESLNGKLQVTIEDPSLSNRQYQLPADLLCLSMPIVPSEGTERIADLFGVPLSDEGFYLEADLKMRPMDFVNEGIFMCGMAHYPRFIEESIASAQAAAGRAITILSQQPMFVGGIIAEVDPDLCVGCLTCVRTCPFTIPKIKFDRAGVGELGGYAWIDPALCQGCGTCTGECPATAINLVNFTDEQMLGDPSWLGSWLPDSTSEIHQTSELADLTPEMSD
ncbi:MAG: 4Fe-4S binding protein, partial [Chloroflexota bacterium]